MRLQGIESGLGFGVLHEGRYGWGSRPWVVPLSVGYQGKWVFLDASGDLVELPPYE